MRFTFASALINIRIELLDVFYPMWYLHLVVVDGTWGRDGLIYSLIIDFRAS